MRILDGCLSHGGRQHEEHPAGLIGSLESGPKNVVLYEAVGSHCLEGLPFARDQMRGAVEEISFEGDRETLTTDGWNQRLWKRRRKKKTEIRLPGDLDS